MRGRLIIGLLLLLVWPARAAAGGNVLEGLQQLQKAVAAGHLLPVGRAPGALGIAALDGNDDVGAVLELMQQRGSSAFLEHPEAAALLLDDPALAHQLRQWAGGGSAASPAEALSCGTDPVEVMLCRQLAPVIAQGGFAEEAAQRVPAVQAALVKEGFEPAGDAVWALPLAHAGSTLVSAPSPAVRMVHPDSGEIAYATVGGPVRPALQPGTYRVEGAILEKGEEHGSGAVATIRVEDFRLDDRGRSVYRVRASVTGNFESVYTSERRWGGNLARNDEGTAWTDGTITLTDDYPSIRVIATDTREFASGPDSWRVLGDAEQKYDSLAPGIWNLSQEATPAALEELEAIVSGAHGELPEHVAPMAKQLLLGVQRRHTTWKLGRRLVTPMDELTTRVAETAGAPLPEELAPWFAQIDAVAAEAELAGIEPSQLIGGHNNARKLVERLEALYPDFAAAVEAGKESPAAPRRASATGWDEAYVGSIVGRLRLAHRRPELFIIPPEPEAAPGRRWWWTRRSAPAETTTQAALPAPAVSTRDISAELAAIEVPEHALPELRLTEAQVRPDELDVDNPDSVRRWGQEIQSELTVISDHLLEGAVSAETQAALDAVDRVVEHLRTIAATEGGDFTRQQLDAIETAVLAHRSVIGDDTLSLRRLREATDTYIANLGRYIRVLDDEAAAVGAALAEDGADIPALQARRERLEQRAHDMRMTQQVAEQSIPTIELLIERNEAVVDRLQSSLSSSLPMLRSRLAQSRAIHRSNSASRTASAIAEAALPGTGDPRILEGTVVPGTSVVVVEAGAGTLPVPAQVSAAPAPRLNVIKGIARRWRWRRSRWVLSDFRNGWQGTSLSDLRRKLTGAELKHQKKAANLRALADSLYLDIRETSFAPQEVHHGWQVARLDDGRVRALQKVDGVRDGFEFVWDPDGVLVSADVWKNGERTVMGAEWYPNGLPHSVTRYSDGEYKSLLQFVWTPQQRLVAAMFQHSNHWNHQIRISDGKITETEVGEWQNVADTLAEADRWSLVLARVNTIQSLSGLKDIPGKSALMHEQGRGLAELASRLFPGLSRRAEFGSLGGPASGPGWAVEAGRDRELTAIRTVDGERKGLVLVWKDGRLSTAYQDTGENLLPLASWDRSGNLLSLTHSGPRGSLQVLFDRQGHPVGGTLTTHAEDTGGSETGFSIVDGRIDEVVERGPLAIE